jgi:hypothetical protein
MPNYLTGGVLGLMSLVRLHAPQAAIMHDVDASLRSAIRRQGVRH